MNNEKIQSALVQPAQQGDPMLAALQKIRDCVPAIDSNGGFFIEHHGPDGEYLGCQQISPVDIIQEMHCIAANAIDAASSNFNAMIAPND